MRLLSTKLLIFNLYKLLNLTLLIFGNNYSVVHKEAIVEEIADIKLYLSNSFRMASNFSSAIV